MAQVLIFGDSITWGAVDLEGMGWANRLQKHVYSVTKGEVQIFNLGIDGDSSNELLKRIRGECVARASFAITAIIIAIGTNDSQYVESKENPRVAPEKFKVNLSEIKKVVEEFTDKIAFIGLTRVDESKTMPTPWNTALYYNNENMGAYDAIIKTFCEREEIPFIELRDLIDGDELSDGVHPNSEGHKKIFEKVRDELEKLGYIS